MKNLKFMQMRKLVFVVVGSLVIAACGGGSAAVEIEGAWVRATAENAKTGAAYMQITADEADRLVAVNVDESVAGRVEIHEVVEVEPEEGAEDDAEPMMSMQQLEDGLDLPAGETVTLRPGGYHIMLMMIGGPFEEGNTVEMELVFETADPITLDVEVMTEAP